MLKNYLKIAWRNLKSNKGFSTINILGLTIGIWACLAIYLVIQDDFRFDQFHDKADQIYRIENNVYLSETGEWQYRSRTPMPWAEALKEEFPEISAAGRFMKSGDDLLFRIDNESFNEGNFLYADNSLFRMFSFNFISGDSQTPLERPNTAVLTEEYAAKYFGSENPIGKTIISEVNWYGPVEYEVTAVVEDLPQNSHFRQGIFLSFPTLEFQLFTDINENWSIHFYYTYLLLEPDADPQALEEKLDAFVSRHYNEETTARYNPSLIALTDIYLHAQGSGQLGAMGSIEYVYAKAIIALFILLIAVFNFVNLSTAQSIERAKEVGIRKVLGADRRALTCYYLSESITYCTIAAFTAVILLYTTLPLINILSGKVILIQTGELASFIPKLGVAVLIIGTLAGLYPSLFLSSFKPTVIFKGFGSSGDKTQIIRRLLVGFQFAISIFLIISTIIVYQQLNFLKERDLGFDKSQLMEIELLSRDIIEEYDLLKSRLSQLSAVQSVTGSTGGVGGELYFNSYNFEGAPGETQRRTFARYAVDNDFFSTMDIPILAGREPDHTFNSDSSGYVVINRTALNEIGWEKPAEAVGTRINYTRPNEEPVSATIIAVSENFHLESPHQQVQPMVMEYWNEALSSLLVKVSNASEENITQVRKVYSEVLPSMPFEFSFLDDRINSIYAEEDKMGTFFFWFAILAIFIACMGLFGVATYAIARRTKEIGIRKVLGADSVQIAVLLSKSFIQLVAIAFVIAAPLAWYAMSTWLNNFAYRIDIGLGIFLISGLTIMTIALLTVSWQSIRAALMDPVESLRSE